MTDSPEPFDLDSFVVDSLPALVDVEADEEAWRYGYGDGRDVRRPATDLLAEDSPLQRYLRAESAPPADANRAERAEFHEAHRAARDAAVQAAQDAAEDHARWVEGQQMRRSADALDALMSRATKAREDRENGTTRTPVREAGKPADFGRW